MYLNKHFANKAYKVFYFEVSIFLLLIITFGFSCIWKQELLSAWRTICITSVEYCVLMWMHIRFLINYSESAANKKLKFQLKNSNKHEQFKQIYQFSKKWKKSKKNRTKIANAMIFCFCFKIIAILLIALTIIYSDGVFSVYAYCATILFGYLIWVFGIIYEFYFKYKRIENNRLTKKQKLIFQKQL